MKWPPTWPPRLVSSLSGTARTQVEALRGRGEELPDLITYTRNLRGPACTPGRASHRLRSERSKALRDVPGSGALTNAQGAGEFGASEPLTLRLQLSGSLLDLLLRYGLLRPSTPLGGESGSDPLSIALNSVDQLLD